MRGSSRSGLCDWSGLPESNWCLLRRFPVGALPLSYDRNLEKCIKEEGARDEPPVPSTSRQALRDHGGNLPQEAPLRR